MTLGFIGTGAITEAIVRGILKTDLAETRILVSARSAETAARLAKLSSTVQVVEDNQEIVDQAEIVFLAVRPQVAREVLGSLAFPSNRQVVSLIATVQSETIKEWIGVNVDVTRAIPLPSVAELSGVTAVYPSNADIEQIFAKLGTAVAATSLAEFDGYAAASALMGTYFGLLETAAGWMTDRGASYDRARQYVGSLIFGLARTTSADQRSFADLIKAHSTPKGLNEQAWEVFRAKDGTAALQGALEAVAERVERTILQDSPQGNSN